MAGFRRPTTTPTPDELFDHWLSRLSGPQVRALLYIIRRTLGFKKKADEISLDQFLYGISSDDDVIDEGCGVRNRRTLTAALEGLAKLGLVDALKRSTPQQGNLTTVYRLVFERDSPRGQGRGFKKPTTTPVPDDLFDYWLTRVTDSELYVLLYIIRRTMGFRKNQETISLKQFLHGIQTDSGRVLDEGCGIRSASTLVAAIDRLVAKELIVSTAQSSPERGFMPTLYRLVFEGDEPDLISVDPRTLPADTSPRRANLSSAASSVRGQQTAPLGTWDTSNEQGRVRETDKGDTTAGQGGYVKRRREVRQLDEVGTGNGDGRSGRQSAAEFSRSGYVARSRGVRRMEMASAVSAPSLRQVPVPGQVRHTHPQQTVDQQTVDQETDTIEDSIGTPATGLTSQDGAELQPQLRVDADYQDLIRPIDDIGREFGDEATTRASVSRAYNLMREANVSTPDFVQLLYEAKALTRVHQAGIVKTRSDSGRLPRKNLMPYFFATLESLLHPDQHPPRRQQGRRPRRFQSRTQQLQRDNLQVARAHQPGVATMPEVSGRSSVSDTTSVQSVDEHPIWRRVLDELSLVLTPENFTTWLEGTRVAGQDGNVLRIAVPKPFHKDWLDNKLRGRIESTVRRLGYDDIQVEFVVASQ